MDLFSLVAKLTLDEKEYEKALKKAESKAKGAKIDAEGSIKIQDSFSANVEKAEQAAKSFQGDVRGEIIADDHYSDKVDAAQKKGEEFDPNAHDDITGTDHYSEVVEAADRAGQEFDPNASDEITGVDQYSEALETAAGNAAGFDPNATDEITADDQYSEALSAADDNARGFSPDAEGEIRADDQYSGALDAAKEKATDFDLTAEGRITADDQYSEALDTAAGKAADFAPDAKDEIEGIDHYSDALEDAKLGAQDFNPNASDEIEADNQYSEALKEAAQDAVDFAPEAQGVIAADDQYGAALATARADAADFDAHAEGEIKADDQFGAALDQALEDASGFNAEAEGTITAHDDYSWVLDQAESDADGADLNVDGVLSMDATEFNDALESAGSNATAFESQFSDMLEGMKNKLKVAGIAAGIIGIGKSFMGAVNASGQLMDTIDKGAQRLDISRKEYQLWDYVLGQSGATIGTVQKGFLNLTKFLNGEGTDDLSAAMDTLKIKPEDYETTEDLFNAVVTALAQMDEGSERSGLVEKIFGRNGVELNAMLNSGADGIAELRQEYEELGLVLSDEDIAKGVAYQDAIDTMNHALGTLQSKLSADVMPLLTGAANEVTKIIGWLTGGEGAPQWLTDIMDSLHSVGEALGFFNENGELQLPDWLKASLVVIADALEIVAKLVSLIVNETTEAKSLKDYIEVFGTVKAGWDAYHMYGKRSREEIEKLKEQLDRDAYVASGAYKEDVEEIKERRESAGASAINANAEMALDEILQAIVNAGGSVTKGKHTSFETVTNPVTGLPEFAVVESPQYTIEYNGQTSVVVQPVNPILGADGSVTTPEDQLKEMILREIGLALENFEAWQGKAIGMWEVPYDDFPAYLHRDEMVLTASQAREYRNGIGGDNSAVVEAIRGLRTDLTNLQLVVGQKTFGRTVVRYGGKRMNGYIGSAEDRVAAGYGWG